MKRLILAILLLLAGCCTTQPSQVVRPRRPTYDMPTPIRLTHDEIDYAAYTRAEYSRLVAALYLIEGYIVALEAAPVWAEQDNQGESNGSSD